MNSISAIRRFNNIAPNNPLTFISKPPREIYLVNYIISIGKKYMEKRVKRLNNFDIKKRIVVYLTNRGSEIRDNRGVYLYELNIC